MLSKSVLIQHIFIVEASPHSGVEACYLTVSKLMVSPVWNIYLARGKVVNPPAAEHCARTVLFGFLSP